MLVVIVVIIVLIVIRVIIIVVVVMILIIVIIIAIVCQHRSEMCADRRQKTQLEMQMTEAPHHNSKMR